MKSLAIELKGSLFGFLLGFFSFTFKMVIPTERRMSPARMKGIRKGWLSHKMAPIANAIMVPITLKACIYPLVSPLSADSVRSGKRAV